jgi:hypothetical protein
MQAVQRRQRRGGGAGGEQQRPPAPGRAGQQVLHPCRGPWGRPQAPVTVLPLVQQKGRGWPSKRPAYSSMFFRHFRFFCLFLKSSRIFTVGRIPYWYLYLPCFYLYFYGCYLAPFKEQFNEMNDFLKGFKISSRSSFSTIRYFFILF